jgi:hypothetical protein
MPDANRLQRARWSLLGLRLGDALGSQFFVPANRGHLAPGGFGQAEKISAVRL